MNSRFQNIADWLVADLDDEEISRYGLFAYLRQAHSELDRNKLFPVWENAYVQYTELKNIEKGLNEALELSPRELTGFTDLQPQFKYNPSEARNLALQIKERLAMARPLLRKICKRSNDQRLELQHALIFEPVGLISSYPEEGMLLLTNRGSHKVWSWHYRFGIQRNRFSHTAVHTRFVGAVDWSYARNLHQVKSECMEQAGLKNTLVNVWYGESAPSVPVFTTLKQVAVFRLLQQFEI